MRESPIFIRTDEMLAWLLRCTEKFPRSQRFRLGMRIEDAAFGFQEAIQAAVRKRSGKYLADADVHLALLRRRLRLARELEFLSIGQYEHVARMTTELGRLLGAWMKGSEG